MMFGRQPDGSEPAAEMDLVRFAIPREQLRGYRIASAPKVLRHFTAAFEPLGRSGKAGHHVPRVGRTPRR